MTAERIAIIGAGLSGTLLAINLLRHTDRQVVLIERSSAKLAKGTAYATDNPRHLLNVRASNMSAFADEPDHFLQWLGSDKNEGQNRFVERRIYGDYIGQLLDEARTAHPQRLRLVDGEAVDVERDDPEWTVHLARGGFIKCDKLVLALGNFPPSGLPLLANLQRPFYFSDPWAQGVTDDLEEDDIVLLLGSGLTAVDVAQSLDSSDFRGKVFALSRRGLRPRSHAPVGPKVEFRDAPAENGAWLVRRVRQRATVVGWRAAVDELRPHIQHLWRRQDLAEKHRFLRHLRPYWDVHRHRLAPAVDARLTGMQMEGRLMFLAGKLTGAERKNEHIHVEWRIRGTDAVRSVPVRRIINCTGPLANLENCPDPLVQRLRQRGTIGASPIGIGIDVNADGRICASNGAIQHGLFAVGPLSRGEAWEIVAVPDIRQQIAKLAAIIS